ncbi:MAG: hypothetical protein L3K15_08540 [Thermoplasmata archaeon]|nr:hypothetical protein [Thermoplasmata archaeon]
MGRSPGPRPGGGAGTLKPLGRLLGPPNMTAGAPRTKWPGPEYVVRQRFRAPLRFVFDWCTDFSPTDPKLEGDTYERRVVERDARRVVVEDLYESPEGWRWSREVIKLRPPHAWHMEGVGNRRNVIADYALTEPAPGVVELELRWRRRPSLLKFDRAPKIRAQKEGKRSWQRFARALERDYRASKTTGKRRGA